jgi:uncharacterized protein YcfJ
MNRSIFSRIALVTLSVIGVATTASAHPPWMRDYGRYDRDDYAPVVNVEPIVQRVRVSNPERECWTEDRPVYSAPSGTEIRSTIVGGLIGAAVGRHIGRDIHDPAAVVGGSLIGAAIGNDIGARRAERRGDYREVGYRPVERCAVSYHDSYEDRIDGYRVTYLYHGREYATRMAYDPGRRVRLSDCD